MTREYAPYARGPVYVSRCEVCGVMERECRATRGIRMETGDKDERGEPIHTFTRVISACAACRRMFRVEEQGVLARAG